MSGVATAIGAAAVGTVAAGAMSASAAKSAANTQAASARNAQEIGLQEFNTITAQNQPYMQSGYGALNQLDYLLGVTPQTAEGGPVNAPESSVPGYAPQPLSSLAGGGFMGAGGSHIIVPRRGGYDPSSGMHIGAGGQISQGIPGGASATPAGSSAGGFGSLLTPFTADYMKQYSPAYQFQLQQGLQGVANADTSSLGALSGAAAKDLIGYNQNFANTAYSNAFNQYQTQQQNIYNRLSGVAQMGQASANNVGQQGTALAGQQANAAVAQGAYNAAGQIGQANAINSTMGNLGNLGMMYMMYGGG